LSDFFRRELTDLALIFRDAFRFKTASFGRKALFFMARLWYQINGG
jgi:hypothetical protein